MPKVGPRGIGGIQVTLPDGSKARLTGKQKRFVDAYLKRVFDTNLGGSAQQMAIVDAGYDVYKKDKKGNNTEEIDYKLASCLATDNLRKPVIAAAIRERLDKAGFNDESVDTELAFLIQQRENLPVKATGIKLYNDLTGRNAGKREEIEKNKAVTDAIKENHGALIAIIGGNTDVPS